VGTRFVNLSHFNKLYVFGDEMDVKTRAEL